MASGSGKDQSKEPVESEESSAATAAAEASPLAPPSDRLQERADGSPEAGGSNPSATTAPEAAAAAQRKCKEIGAPSWRRDAGGKPPLPPRAASVSRESEPKSAASKPPLPPRAVRASKPKGKEPMTDATKDGEEVFDELLEESKAMAGMDQKDEPEGTAMQQEQVKLATIWPENYHKGSIWRKVSDRIGTSDLNCRIVNPDVSCEVFDELLEESKVMSGMDWKDEPEGTAMRHEVSDRIGTSDLNCRIVNPDVSCVRRAVGGEHKAMPGMDWKDEPEGTAMRHKVESAAIWPESFSLRSLWREVKSATIWPESCYLDSLIRKLCRRDMLVLAVILTVSCLPARAEAFRRYETVQDAANALPTYVDVDGLRNRLQEGAQAPTAGLSFGVWFMLITFGVCLLGALASGFVGKEPALAVGGQPPVPRGDINIDSTALLLLLVTLVTLVAVIVRCMGA